MPMFESNKSYEYFLLLLTGRGHMPFAVICSLLSLILALFLKSLSRSKGAFAQSQSGIEDAEVKKGVFGVPSTAIGTLDPLQSFGEGNINYSIFPDPYSRRLSPKDGNAVEHR
jgi:hypothetical protein